MNYRPKQYYVAKQPVPVAPEDEGESLAVYFRNGDGSLGQINAALEPSEGHKDAIFKVKEHLVAEGDCLTNKAVLAVIKGGKNG